VLQSTRRDIPPRQRSLRAALEWSYELLTEDERLVFERAGIFQGGFDLEAAEEVIGDDLGGRHVIEVIEALVLRSMIRRQPLVDRSGESRLTMLETVRDLAREKLAARPGGRAACEERHARYWLRRAEEWCGTDLYQPRHLPEEFFRLRQESENLLAARRHLIATDPAAGARITLAMEPWISTRASTALRDELRTEAIEAAKAAGAGSLATRLLSGRAIARWLGGRTADALADAEEGLRLCPEETDPITHGYMRSTRGVVVLHTEGGETEAAAADHEAARQIGLRVGHVALQATAAIGLSGAAQRLGRIDEACGWLETSVTQFRQIGSPRSEALPLAFLGPIYSRLGRVREAGECYDRAHAIQSSYEDTFGQSMTMMLRGDLRGQLGDWDRARDEVEAGARLAARSGIFHTEIGAAVSLMSIELGAGHLDAARRHADRAIRGAMDMKQVYYEGRVRLHLAALAALAGDLPSADDELARGESLLSESADHMEGFRLLRAIVERAHAQAVRARGDQAAAMALEVRVTAAHEAARARRLGILLHILDAHLPP
jgi:tetratricopeptide (TPR) repeat protein